jgi:FkbM family methyltransferase
LKKNVAINGYSNVVCIQKAVSNSNGKLRLYLSENNKGDHRIYESSEKRESIEIESVTLDDYFKEFTRKISFIKIDTQGADGFVFQGMTDLLKRNDDVVIMSEFWPIGLKRCGMEPIDYLKIVEQHGFKLCQLLENCRKKETSNIDELSRLYTVENEQWINLLLKKIN